MRGLVIGMLAPDEVQEARRQLGARVRALSPGLLLTVLSPGLLRRAGTARGREGQPGRMAWHPAHTICPDRCGTGMLAWL